MADLAAGLHIVYGVLAALIARDRTGRGQRVDVNMLNSLLALEHQEIASYLYTGELSPRANSGLASAYAGAPLGIYPTADGWLALSMQPLGRLAGLLGIDDFAGVDSSNVIDGRDDIKRRLEEATRTRTTSEWLDHLLAHDVWCAPVNDLDRVVEDPQVVHNDILIEVDHRTAGPVRVVGSPVRFSEHAVVGPAGTARARSAHGRDPARRPRHERRGDRGRARARRLRSPSDGAGRVKKQSAIRTAARQPR